MREEVYSEFVNADQVAGVKVRYTTIIVIIYSVYVVWNRNNGMYVVNDADLIAS